MKKNVTQTLSVIITMLLLTAGLTHSQTVPRKPDETIAVTPQQTTPCAEITDAKDKSICELSLMVNKTLSDKRAAIALAESRLEVITEQKTLTAEQRQLAVDLRKTIADLKDQIGFYKDFVELLYKRPPKKCFISVFNC